MKRVYKFKIYAENCSVLVFVKLTHYTVVSIAKLIDFDELKDSKSELSHLFKHNLTVMAQTWLTL